MRFEIGKPIMTSDGRQAGKVDSFVLSPETRDLVAIISQEGFIFTEDRIIEADHIDHVDEDGTIHLNLPEDEVDDLPTVASARFTFPEHENVYRTGDVDHDAFVTGAGYTYYTATTRDYKPIAGRDSIFGIPDPTPPPLEVESNLGELNVVIDEGTDVIDSNGEKIGEVQELAFDGDDIVGIVVEAGFLFHHKIRVPAHWIVSATHEEVRLNQPAEVIEREGRIDE